MGNIMALKIGYQSIFCGYWLEDSKIFTETKDQE